MGTFNEIEGDLIKLSKTGLFDVISHGCNCQCKMKSGLAPQMAEAFGCDTFYLEKSQFKGDINKLGQIDFERLHFSNWDKRFQKYPDEGDEILFSIYVVNSYTQFIPDKTGKPLDYEALTLCMRKINFKFKGQKIGLPKLGAGLGGGNWERIKEIIKTELKDCDVTIVHYKP